MCGCSLLPREPPQPCPRPGPHSIRPWMTGPGGLNRGPGLARADCSQTVPTGARRLTAARQAPQEEPRPFLSALPTAQNSQACAKGKLQLSKPKTPKEELPRQLWKTAGPPPLHRAPWADSQGLGGTAGHSPAVTQGLASGPAPVDGMRGGKPPGSQPQGPPAPTPPSLGLARLSLDSPSF